MMNVVKIVFHFMFCVEDMSVLGLCLWNQHLFAHYYKLSYFSEFILFHEVSYQ